jgi:ferredoxin, 2Fe-2S
MPRVNFTTPAGDAIEVESRAGSTIMEAAVKHGVPGIVAECGGGLSCATCHVYVAAEFADATGPTGDFEDEMLEDAVAERRASSRLSCQITLTEDLDGIAVEVAPEQ